MKKVVFSLLSILMLVAMIISISVMSVSAEGNADLLSNAETVDYYGRDALSKLPSSADLLYAYDAICEGVEGSVDKIKVYDTAPNLTVEQISSVMDAYRRDHAEHFWLGTQYSYLKDASTNYVHSVAPSYIMEGDELTQARARFEEEIAGILSGITPEMTEFEKELYLHDTLAKRIEYVTDAPNAHDAYGALVLGEAVCEGYAESLQVLLQRVGIQSFLALGVGLNPTTGEGEGHEWNFVRIDGSYYQVDLTWADQGERIYHAYFNQTDGIMSVDHALESTAYALPKCTDTAAFYYNVLGGSYSDYTVSGIGELLKANGLKTMLYVPTGAEPFKTWFAANIRDIAGAAGVSGAFTYGYTSLANEVYIYINDCKHTVDKLTLIKENEATCLEPGNIKYYQCECGNLYSYSYNILGQFDGKQITKKDTVIPAKGHDYTECIEDAAHLHTKGDCQTHPIYWYDCSRCDSNAKNDKNGSDFHYTSLNFGDHNISELWTSKDEKHFRECLVQGCDYTTEGEACYGGEASCISRARCEICNGEHGTTLPHSFLGEYVKEAEGHAHGCTTKGCTEHDAFVSHTSSGEATEDDAEYCLDCGYIITPALSHDEHTPKEEWESDENGHWHECTGCEGERLDYSAHDFDNSCDSLCETCNREREVTHTPSDMWHSDEGFHWQTCPCGEVHNKSSHTDENSDKKCDICGYSTPSDTFILFDINGDKWMILGYETDPQPVIITLAVCLGLILLVIIFRKRH
ncbi:MAG: hypothetical protein IJY24_03955 [Clostridia bacterium]|nr:hypothetical protein [Clostridia bacterium]